MYCKYCIFIVIYFWSAEEALKGLWKFSYLNSHKKIKLKLLNKKYFVCLVVKISTYRQNKLIRGCSITNRHHGPTPIFRLSESWCSVAWHPHALGTHTITSVNCATTEGHHRKYLPCMVLLIEQGIPGVIINVLYKQKMILFLSLHFTGMLQLIFSEW